MASEAENKLGSGCMVVFGSVFLVVGLGIGYLALSMLLDWTRARKAGVKQQDETALPPQGMSN